MLKEKDLTTVTNASYQDGSNVTLPLIANDIRAIANNYQIPIEITQDQIKFGGLIGGSTNDCIVMYHPQHRRDYYNMAIAVRNLGVTATVSVYQFGQSKTMKKEALWGGQVGGGLGQRAIRGLSLMGNKGKMEAENDWYNAVAQIIQEALSGS